MTTPDQQAAAEAQEREERDAEARADGHSFARTVGEGAAATVDTARAGAGAIGDAVGGAAGTVRDQGVVGAAAGAGAATGRHVSRSVNRVNWGGLVGGLLGVFGAWLGSSMFGGGMFGTIAFMLLAIPGFLMGRGFGARNMNSLFGGENDPTPERAAQPQLVRNRDVEGPAAAQPQTTTPEPVRMAEAQQGLDAATLDSIQQTQAIYARSGARLQPGDFGLADATSAVPVVPGQQAALARG
ncbi:MAG: hypothetical protein DI582_06635 [Azospirillum brasilense]|nr:MAG: hypothetical protein DI582_06635 [Azospirillum brasilense]